MRFLVAAALILATSCSRSGPAARLAGSWRLTGIQGGFAGVDIRVPADSPVVLTLNNDYSYFVHNRGALVASGIYRLTDTAVFSTVPKPVIIFENGSPTLYQLGLATLVLGTTIDDNLQQTYVRAD